MFNLIPLKGALYAGFIIIVVGSAWYVVNDWHYKPIRVFERQVKTLTIDNKAKDVTINNLSVQIVELIENNKVTNFESYFLGISESNTTVSEKLIF